MFVVIFLLGAAEVSMDLLSSVRAYVGGESQWSKGQKDATHFLNVYAQTRNENDYQRYLKTIAAPLGDHRARLALEQAKPDLETARQGFLDGNNHPDDIPGIITLFRLFRHTPLMEKPIAIWTEADVHLGRLDALAHQLHANINATDGTQAERARLLAEINAVSLKLTPLEDAFSRTLGEVSRQTSLLIDIVITLMTVLLLGLGLLLSWRMVQRSVASANALQQNELWMRTVVDTSMDAVVGIDAESIITLWNHQAEIVFGWSAAEALGQPMHQLIIPHGQREQHLQGVQRFMASGIGPTINRRVEMQALRRDGSEFPAELTIAAIMWQGTYTFCAFIRDITEDKHVADQLINLAHYDTTTGLPNKAMFQDRLSQEIKQSNRTDQPLAVMFLDVDHFKDINDTLGHDKGDLLLRQTAERLLGCVRDSDTVARFGGDEFVVLLSQFDDLGAVDLIAQRMLATMNEPFQLDSELAYVSVSIGITVYPVDADTHDQLIKNADQAMYEVKKNGRNSFTYFTRTMQEAAQIRRQMATDLHSALEQQQCQLYYQPIVHLATGGIHKAEALIRWNHPTHGLISPTAFIPIAEETGMIIEIGEWVFRTAVKQAAKWRTTYYPDFQISVNKSPAQFQESDETCAAWSDHLQLLGLPGQSIVVEITEGMLVEASKSTQNQLLDFRDAGIQVALDDFGTGYSSLSYLNKFDIDYIKIDRSFVQNLKPDSDNLVLCEAIIAMAHKLAIQVIAEGIETLEQRDLLIAAGCDYGQGFLFARPAPAEVFETLLQPDHQWHFPATAAD